MQRRYVTVDVFTDRVFGSNPLAVVDMDVFVNSTSGHSRRRKGSTKATVEWTRGTRQMLARRKD